MKLSDFEKIKGLIAVRSELLQLMKEEKEIVISGNGYNSVSYNSQKSNTALLRLKEFIKNEIAIDEEALRSLGVTL